MIINTNYKNISGKIDEFLSDNDLIGNEPFSIIKLRNSLKEKIKDSIEIINDSINKFDNKNLSISFNGGKDCLVMLYLYIKVLNDRQLLNNTKINSVYIYYEETFKEIENFNKVAIKDCNLNLQTYSYCKLKEGFEKYLNDNPSIEAIIVGNRRTDPYSENLNSFQKTDNDWPKFIRIHPILNWKYQEIWFFLLHFNIDYCDLYNFGYTSIGGINSTIKNPFLEKQNFKEKNPDLNYAILNWMVELFDKDQLVNEDNEFYPAFYLQNDDYERFSRSK